MRDEISRTGATSMIQPDRGLIREGLCACEDLESGQVSLLFGAKCKQSQVKSLDG